MVEVLQVRRLNTLVLGPRQLPKFKDAQVPYISGVVFTYNLCTSSFILEIISIL